MKTFSIHLAITTRNMVGSNPDTGGDIKPGAGTTADPEDETTPAPVPAPAE